MKKSLLLFIFILFISISQTFAQGGLDGFQYQAVVRKSDGKELTNQKVSAKFTIFSKTPSGNVDVYSEVQQVTTNQFGLISHIIGRGRPQSAIKLSDVDFSVSNYYLKVELDLTGGSNYQPFGSTELIAVPFALYAKSSGSSSSGGNGVKGDKGDTGPQGPQGVAGSTGPQGLQGAAGVKGDKGDKGEIGPQGLQGLAGVKGDTGPQGLKGDKGETGATGPQGLEGV